MNLFYKEHITRKNYLFDSIDERAIVQDLENSFYNGIELTDASSFNEIELISCLLQTLVNKGHVDSCFKKYLVGLLNETKKELIEAEDKLAKAWEEVQRLKEKNRELVEKQGAKK